jgi:SAM-dependent methyltransferase
MREIVLAHVPRDRAVSIVDFGCGTGVLLFRLAELLPQANLLGIDISAANMRAAECERSRHSHVDRLCFMQGDYFQCSISPADVIVADGVLQLVPGDVAPMFEKLAGDLRSGGILICSMPYACLYNRAFSLLRRVLARAQSGWLDRLILGLARVAYGRDMDDDRLRERIHYMYVAPERLMNPASHPAVSAAGFDLVRQYPMATRFSQLKYAVTVLRRR